MLESALGGFSGGFGIFARRAFHAKRPRYTSAMMNAGITLSAYLLESDLMAESTAMGEDIATEQIVALILLASLIIVATWLFFVWAIRDKQFEEVEEISLRVLELDAEQNHAEVMP